MLPSTVKKVIKHYPNDFTALKLVVKKVDVHNSPVHLTGNE